ncbi:hypothetical protein FACS1894120_2040 [Clostridia bacterium]|nr:hypothetical protein FACS1894120_2040 [Clostridia bacterium]
MTYKQLIKTRGFLETHDIGFFRVEHHDKIQLMVKDLREPSHYLIYSYNKYYGYNLQETCFPPDSEREKQAMFYFNRHKELCIGELS